MRISGDHPGHRLLNVNLALSLLDIKITGAGGPRLPVIPMHKAFAPELEELGPFHFQDYFSPIVNSYFTFHKFDKICTSTIIGLIL